MNARRLLTSISIFVSGLTLGIGLMLIEQIPRQTQQQSNITPTLSDDRNVNTNILLPSTESMSFIERLAEAENLRQADEKNINKLRDTYSQPIPDDWEGIKAIALRENTIRETTWQRLNHWEIIEKGIINSEQVDDEKLKEVQDIIKQIRDSITTITKEKLREPFNVQNHHKQNQTGYFRYKHVIDEFIGPEMAAFCNAGDTTCTQPIRVNFLCDMSQIIVCQQIARAIRASTDFVLMYPFEKPKNPSNMEWDITFVYSDFAKDTVNLYTLVVAKKSEHTKEKFVLEIDEKRGIYLPSWPNQEDIIVSLQIADGNISGLLEKIKEDFKK